ncbi:MAG: Flp family type IVb pilin [Chloroflexi bacterium]|nr:Flp family type IVb pilin [Chloroflexota bacterium]
MRWSQVVRGARALHRDERGAAMVEYAIVTAVIAVVALTAAQALGGALTDVFNDITAALEGI